MEDIKRVEKLTKENDPFGYKRAERLQDSRDAEFLDMMKKLKEKDVRKKT